MLEFRAFEFELTMTPTARNVEEGGGPYLDWISLDVKLVTPSVKAEMNWQVMPSELTRFRSETEVMHQTPSRICTASLVGADRGMSLVLQSTGLGGILGKYAIQLDPSGDTKIEGRFGIDQSYLPDILNGLNDLLSFDL